jgi:hypothetical protein
MDTYKYLPCWKHVSSRLLPKMTFKPAFSRIIRLISLCSKWYDCNILVTARTGFQQLRRFQIVNAPWRSACTQTGLCVDLRIAPMFHNCFVSLQGHPLSALFFMIWDQLEVSHDQLALHWHHLTSFDHATFWSLLQVTFHPNVPSVAVSSNSSMTSRTELLQNFPTNVAYMNVLPTCFSMNCYSLEVASEHEWFQIFWHELQAKSKNSYNFNTCRETILS